MTLGIRWRVGDRVVWPHSKSFGASARVIRSAGTVIAVDEPGLPPGVRVQFDWPGRWADDCYATHDELEPE